MRKRSLPPKSEVGAGSRKRPAPGLRIPRFTTHKVRTGWFRSRICYPDHEGNVAYLVGCWKKDDYAWADTGKWQCVGPTNVGGRMTCLAVHPRTPDTIYIGAAAGGVWRSLDAGEHWTPLWDDREVLNIGSLAVDPRHPEVIYCGTGEANGSVDSYPGVGLFRSTDAGEQWELIACAIKHGVPRRIGTIAVNPKDSKHILIGGICHADDANAGMWASRDGGVTWERQSFISEQNYFCHSIVFHPDRPEVIFATFDAHGAQNGIWRSKDGGKTWGQLTCGLPSPELFGRTSLAIAPVNPFTIYAFAGDHTEGVLGVFRSLDAGDVWSSIGGRHFSEEGQMSYNNCIAVHPEDHEHAVFGGTNLHRTTDGGSTWAQISEWDALEESPDYVHSDHHALVIPPGTKGRIYNANDGGMFVSDNGLKWKPRRDGLATTMFYDVDVAPTDGTSFGGGTQDNGTVLTIKGKKDSFTRVLGGDGGWMVYDPADEAHIYGTSQNMVIERHRDDEWITVTPSDAGPEERRKVWMAILIFDPVDSNVVYAGSDRVWKTKDDAEYWTAVSPVLDGSIISAIEVASAKPKCVYVGTTKGGFYRSLDGGNTWSGNLAGPRLPGRIITRIESHPKQHELVFLTVGTFSTTKPFPHVFRSDDGGLHWTDSDRGRLPNVSHQALAFRTDSPDSLFVANDMGVFLTEDLGKTWKRATRGLPNTIVVDLVYHEKDQTLTAATYGRSLWRLRLD